MAVPAGGAETPAERAGVVVGTGIPLLAVAVMDVEVVEGGNPEEGDGPVVLDGSAADRGASAGGGISPSGAERTAPTVTVATSTLDVPLDRAAWLRDQLTPSVTSTPSDTAAAATHRNRRTGCG